MAIELSDLTGKVKGDRLWKDGQIYRVDAVINGAHIITNEGPIDNSFVAGSSSLAPLSHSAIAQAAAAGELGSSTSAAGFIVILTQAEYDALSESEKENGKLYLIDSGV